jgi:hypothetical protein
MLRMQSNVSANMPAMHVLHGLPPYFRHVFQGWRPKMPANVGFRAAIVAFAASA